MGEQCLPPAPLPAPSWRLEALTGLSEDSKSKPSWRLTILFPEGCLDCSILGVDYSSDELRLDVADLGRWKLPVPDCAQPVDCPKCKVSRHRRELRVEWVGGEQCVVNHLSAQMESPCFQDNAHLVADVAEYSKANEEENMSVCCCHWCGKEGALLLCTKCRAACYCSAYCQREAWTFDHRSRCALASRALAAQRQRKRGDTELAIATLEDAIREVVKVAKAEATKEFTFDQKVATALFRGVASLIVLLSAALADVVVPDSKFCRAAFLAIGAFLDMAAALGEQRRPEEIKFHLDLIVSGLGEQLNPDADPILSAWMFYDSFSRGLQDRPSNYYRKVKQIKVGALVGLRDILAASHDILTASEAVVDHRQAKKADKLLDLKQLQVGQAGFKELMTYWPKGESSSDFPEANLDNDTASDTE